MAVPKVYLCALFLVLSLNGLQLAIAYSYDCNKFHSSDGLDYAAGLLFVTQPSAQNVLVVDTNFQIRKVIQIPGSDCGGVCHPIAVSINVARKAMALAAKNGQGKSYVMMYTIQGNFNRPETLGIQHYYTMRQLFNPGGYNADVKGVAFCGDRFAYADYRGAIYNWRLQRYTINPLPDLYERVDWYIDRSYNVDRSKLYYFGCSNNGEYWVVEKTNYGQNDDGVGAIPVTTTTASNNVLNIATIVVFKRDISTYQRSRLNKMKGIAMDSRKNLFYSAEPLFANGVNGIYQRKPDGSFVIIREWAHRPLASKVEMFGMAADDQGSLFIIQRDPLVYNARCLYKYGYNG